MLNPLRVLGSAVIVLLCLSAYQTYQNAADCRFYGLTYSWFRGACVGPRSTKRKAASAFEQPFGLRTGIAPVETRSVTL